MKTTRTTQPRRILRLAAAAALFGGIAVPVSVGVAGAAPGDGTDCVAMVPCSTATTVPDLGEPPYDDGIDDSVVDNGTDDSVVDDGGSEDGDHSTVDQETDDSTTDDGSDDSTIDEEGSDDGTTDDGGTDQGTVVVDRPVVATPDFTG